MTRKIGNNPILPYQVCQWRRARVWGKLVWYCETHKKLRNSSEASLPKGTCSKGVEVGKSAKDWNIPVVF